MKTYALLYEDGLTLLDPGISEAQAVKELKNWCSDEGVTTLVEITAATKAWSQRDVAAAVDGELALA